MKVLLASFLYAICFLSSAQVTFGPKFGVTSFYQKYHFSGVYSTYNKPISNPKVGYMLGAVVNYKFNDWFAIRPELLFEHISFETVTTDPSLKPVIYQQDLNKFNYLSLPVNIVLSNRSIQFIAGPQIDYFVGGNVARTTITNDSLHQNVSNQQSLHAVGGKQSSTSGNNYYLNPINLSLNIGGGYRTKRILFTAQYNFGLTNVTPHNTNSLTESNRSHFVVNNRGGSLAITYFFGSME